MDATKTCNKCKKEKSINEFHRNKRSPDGRVGRCRVCTAAYHKRRDKANPEVNKATRKRVHAKKRAKKEAAYKEYLNDPTSTKTCYVCETAKLFTEFNKSKSRKDGLGALCKLCSRIHRQKWAKEHPAFLAAKEARRRATKIQNTPLWVDKKAVDEFYDQAQALYELTGIEFDVDHIFPLLPNLICNGEPVHGMHSEWNLQLLIRHTNQTKSNKI